MSLFVGTNTSALYSQNALKSNARLTATAMERLSTGLRVSSAKDDAAGLAISQGMTSQIRGLNQAVRNINDGINLLQAGDGGLSSISDMLQRMRELATQSSNGTLSGSDRIAINSEFTLLQNEALRIKNSQQWNGIKLLDGSFDNVIQVGSNAGDTSRVSIPGINLSGIQNNPITGSGVLHGTPGGTQDYTTVVDIDTTSYSSGGTIAIVIQLGNGASGASYDLYKNAITTNVRPINSLANAYDVGPGSTVNLSYTFAASPSDHYILGFEGNWFSSPQSTNTFNYSITVSGATVTPSSSIATQLEAVNSLNQIDRSIASVNNSRAAIGSYINRLTYTADNATNMSSNLTASRSTIMDADYAVESTNLARTQVIQQAATAMLAQANQQPQAVLALLKNL
jgi:flagellin